MAADSAAPLVTVTLGWLLRALPRSVRVLHPGPEDSAVRWVGSSELDDPVPFLVPGEVLLTSGMPFRPGASPDDDDEAADRFVASLAAAEVRALGLGLSPHHDRVPPAVLAACRRHGLGLFEIPPEVSFAAIGMEFAQLMETARAQVLRSLHESTRRLLAAAMSPHPEQEVLAALVGAGADWSVLLGADAEVRAGDGPASPEQLRPLLERALSGTGRRLEIARLEGLDAPFVELHPLSTRRGETMSVLVVGSRAPLDPSAAGTARVAVTVLEVLQQRHQGRSAQVGELAARLLLEARGSGSGLSELVLRSSGAAPGESLRVVMGVPRERACEPPTELLWSHLLDTHLVIPDPEGFTAITRVDPSSAAIVEAERRGWLLAIGEPVGPEGLQEAAQEVSVTRELLRRSDRSLRAGEQPLSVTALVGPRAGAALARHLLAPLLGSEPETAQKRRILAEWLSRSQSWEAVARELGLHRNTVRRQIEVIEQELGLDLGDAAVRTDLWVALRFADGAGPGAQRSQRA